LKNHIMVTIKRGKIPYKFITLMFIIILAFMINIIFNKKVVGGIVYRINEDHSIHYLLVTTKNDDKWIFPKGKVKFYESQRRAAQREVGEEAGIKTDVNFKLKRNPFLHQKSTGEKQFIDLYAMKYIKEKNYWKERNDRRRKWMTFPEASSVLTSELRAALEEVQFQLKNNLKMQ
jgi:8-oxo-dGTP pyrophosphatase MutT (NUDIX family)